MNLKDLLKALKMNESTISTVLGFLVIVAVGLVVVNYFRNIQPEGQTFPTGATTENTTGDLGTYTVKAGDTLWSIAQDYYGDGYKWSEIAKANNITDPNEIEKGQKLDMPQIEGTESNIAIADKPDEQEEVKDVELGKSNEVLAQETDTSAPVSHGGTYTVVHGDNLWDIAVAEYGDGYRWIDIARANNLVHPGIIHAGNILTIPA